MPNEHKRFSAQDSCTASDYFWRDIDLITNMWGLANATIRIEKLKLN